jgi:hypothetical protein
MHVHLEYIEDPAILAMFLANGVTTVRNMDGRPYILVLSGDLIGPAIRVRPRDSWGSSTNGGLSSGGNALILCCSENVANVRAIAGVMVRGRWVSPSDLKAMLKPRTLASSQ